ncbi:MAG: DMT family transporter [Pseudomonadota bacterium]
MQDSTAYRPQRVLLGVVLIVAAAFAISVQDVVFKLFSSELSLWQIFALRGVIAIPMLLAVCWARGVHVGLIKAALGRWPMTRAVCITTTFLAFYAAIPFLSLSTVGAANYIAPIFITLLSAYVLRDCIGWLGWLGVLLGFAGVVVLLQPGTDAFSPWALLPIFGAGFYAIGHIVTRSKCQFVSLPAMALALNIVMLLAGAIVSSLLLVLSPRG